MLNIKLDKINFTDIDNLFRNSIPEGKTLEYKREISISSDLERKEFLSDVSSFANSSGGDLIFGIETVKGSPSKIHGLIIENVDSEILKLENIIRDGIEPRINVSTIPITTPENKIILVMRIDKSWNGPHRVIFKSHDKFYARNSAGKYALDTNELRRAFSISQTLIEKVDNFKNKRILELISNNTAVPFEAKGKIALHIIPLEAFNHEFNIDMTIMKDVYTKLTPMRASSWNNRINLEGIVIYTSDNKKKSHSYVQLYRSGIIEAVTGVTLKYENENKKIPITAWEGMLMKSLTTYLNTLRELAVTPPIIIFLTLIDVKGYILSSNNLFFDSDEDNTIDRDVLALPETIINSYDTTSSEILRPLFDLIWNACGYERSFSFDKDGKWIGK